MNIIRIPKRNGSFRTIYAPNAEERQKLNERMPALSAFSARNNPRGVQHGFMRSRSPVTNARAHVGYGFTLKMDLADFFDSVTPELVPEEIRFPECFPDGAARQGLPTSPALANIAASKMDEEILALCPPFTFTSRMIDLLGDAHSKCVYTRYADDLTFSSDHIDRLLIIRSQVPVIARKYGFAVNERKTVIQSAKAGRRVITGIAVDNVSIYPTRRMKRRLRAAKHKRNTAQARGLAEWMKLTTPRGQSFGSSKVITQAIKAAVQAVASIPQRIDRAVTRLFDLEA